MRLDVFLKSQMSSMIHCYVFSTYVFSSTCLCVISSERTNKLLTLTGFFLSLFHSVFITHVQGSKITLSMRCSGGPASIKTTGRCWRTVTRQALQRRVPQRKSKHEWCDGYIARVWSE